MKNIREIFEGREEASATMEVIETEGLDLASRLDPAKREKPELRPTQDR